MAFVFGYGSLVSSESLKRYVKEDNPRFQYITIQGLRRDWSVAMDNSVDLPAYKYYLDENDVRIQKYVAFLNVAFDPSKKVNGILFEVDSAKLPSLDLRERNYDRVEITHLLPEAYRTQTVWTYMGKEESKKRFSSGYDQGKVVIHEAYLEQVMEAFISVSYAYLIQFIKETDFNNLPIIPLQRIDL